MIKIDSKKIIIPLIMATMVCLASCSNDGNSGKTDGEEPIVIEPGVVENKDPEETDPADTPSEEFMDKWEDTTIDDLIAAHGKITSYYFEQTITYAYGSVFLNVLYADNKMKVFADAAGN